MKSHFFILFVFFLSSCENKRTNSYEDLILECRFAAMGYNAIEFKESWKDFELSIAQQGLLLDNRALDYKKLLTQIANNDVPNDVDYTSLRHPDIISTQGVVGLDECIDHVNLTIPDIEKRTMHKFQQITDEMLGGTSSRDTAQKLLVLFKDKDYEFKLYQYLIVALASEYYFEEGVINDGYTIPKGPIEVIIACDDLNFYIDDKDLLSIDEEYIQTKHIRNKTLRFLKNFKGDVCINISWSRQCSFDYYQQVKNEITAALNFYKDQRSKRIYNRMFHQLSDSEKEVIINERKIDVEEN